MWLFVIDVLLSHLSLLLSCFIPRSQTDLTHSLLIHSCHFSLFSTILSCLTRTIWTGGSDNTNSTCAPLQHHTDWYSAQFSWISPSICSNQSHGPQSVQQTVDMRFTVEIKIPLSFHCAWFDIFVCYCTLINCTKVKKSIMSSLGVCPKMNTYSERQA